MKQLLFSLFLSLSLAGFSQKTIRTLPQKITASLTDTIPAQNVTTQALRLDKIYSLFFPGTTLQYTRGDGSLATFPTSNTAFSNGAGYLLPADITGKADKATTLTINGTTFDLSQSRNWTIAGGGSTTLNDNLTTSSAGAAALDAHQGLILKGLIDGNTTSIGNKVDKTTTISVNGANPQALTGNVNLTVSGGGTSGTDSLKSVSARGAYSPYYTRFGDTSMHKATGSSYFFGNSITGGANASVPANRWTSIVSLLLSTIEVNRGIPGTTMQKQTNGDSSMIDRINSIPTYIDGATEYLFFAFGTNDAHKAWTDTATFRTNYYRVLDTCFARGWSGNRIVLMTQGYYNDISGGASQTKRLAWDNVTRSVAAVKGVGLGDVWALMLKEGYYNTLSSDSLHPNNAGHLKWARAALNGISLPHATDLVNHGRFFTNYVNIYGNPNDPYASLLSLYDSTRTLASELRVNAAYENMFFGINGGSANTTATNNTSFGSNSMTSTTTGGGNTAMGGSALRSTTTGINNTVMGYNALRYNTTGNKNTAIGTLTMSNTANTASTDNTAVGYWALLNNKANNNTAIGSQSLVTDTTGNDNTTIGYQSMFNTGTGIQNTVGGSQSLFANTTGSLNTAFGFNSLKASTTASNNTAFGGKTLLSNVTGTLNTALGFQGLQNNTGNNNTGAGARSMESNTTGANNTAIGYLSGFSNTTGSLNIYIGANAGFNAAYASLSNHFGLGNNTTLLLMDGTMGTTTAAQSVTINGVLNTTGAKLAFASKTATYTATINDEVIKADATTAAFSVTLPTAVGNTGQRYIIKKTDASANAITIATTSSQTIDGATTYSLPAQNKYVAVVSDGANWMITANN